MSFQSIIRWFLPREDQFYRLLEKQADITLKASQELAQFKDQHVVKVCVAVQRVEHEGDDLVNEIEANLARTFVTPLDREDIHKVSSELDDIVDIINVTARSCSLYGVTEPTEDMVRLIDILVSCTQQLATALPRLRKHQYAELISDVRSIKKMEREGDKVFRRAIGTLFNQADPHMDTKTLFKRKEILEDLESAIDLCYNVAKTLASIAVKHG